MKSHFFLISEKKNLFDFIVIYANYSPCVMHRRVVDIARAALRFKQTKPNYLLPRNWLKGSVFIYIVEVKMLATIPSMQ